MCNVKSSPCRGFAYFQSKFICHKQLAVCILIRVLRKTTYEKFSCQHVSTTLGKTLGVWSSHREKERKRKKPNPHIINLCQNSVRIDCVKPDHVSLQFIFPCSSSRGFTLSNAFASGVACKKPRRKRMEHESVPRLPNRLTSATEISIFCPSLLRRSSTQLFHIPNLYCGERDVYVSNFNSNIQFPMEGFGRRAIVYKHS